MPTEPHPCALCKNSFDRKIGFVGRLANYCSKGCRDAASNGRPAPAKSAVPGQQDSSRAAIGRAKSKASKKRGHIDPATCERDYSDDEHEFLKAVERYQREAKRPFPTWTELLEIAVSLGYRKVAPAGPLPGTK